MKKFLILTAISLLFVCNLDAFAGDVEKSLSRDLSECARIAGRIVQSSGTNGPSAADIAIIKKSAEGLHADRLLLAERQGAMAERTATLGSTAASRQEAAASPLLAQLDDLLERLDSIGSNFTASDLESLKQLLETLVPRKSRPLLGALPYRHTNYPSREPASAPTVKPAYKGGERSVVVADTAATPEAPFSKEIIDLAQSLQWSPVLIYEWVKNNVETEWYWGSMKGAEETLRQKSGNDADQATLLVALLRASGFPARFLKGTIEFFPDMNMARNLTGLDDPAKIYTFLQKSGIPVKPVIAGGTIGNFQFEHIWVEAYIPYSNYRGAVIDDQGKIWAGLDTSIKPQGFIRTHGSGVPADILAHLRDEYLSATQTLSPLDYLKGKLNDTLAGSQPPNTWSELKDTYALIPEVLKIIPASLQFSQIEITGEYQALPDELKHKVTFSATTGGNELFTITLDAQKLSNRKIVVLAEPESVEDQNTIDSFGGLDNTPAYLVHLRPVLIIDGERIIVAQEGLPMGGDFTLAIDIITPNGTERITSNQINGNLSVIGVVSQKAAAPLALADTDDADTILHKEAIGYIERWNRSEDDLAALLGQSISRPTVTIATVGAQLEVTRLIETPYDLQWQGLFLDAGYRRIETVGRDGLERDFMRLSALQGSYLENRVFEDDLQVDSISTAKLLQLAKTNATPVVTLDKTNVDALLPTFVFDEIVKQDIANAINQNLTVTIPQAEITYQDWNGVGYVKENQETGESGWMLSGNVAGGMTVWSPDKWDNAAIQTRSDALRAPYGGKPNTDPVSAMSMVKIPDTDQQVGVVGRALDKTLQVKVLDKQKRPVKGASVTFTIRAGGGTLGNKNDSSFTANTNRNGIASVYLTVGKKTADNPIYWVTAGNVYSDQYGGNVVDAATNTDIAITTPFVAYGKPDRPVQIEKLLGEENRALPNNPAGSLLARVIDQFGNPISNIPVTFTALPPTSRNSKAPFPPNPRLVSFYRPMECTVDYPLYGDCPSWAGLVATSDWTGAAVNAMMGDTVETDHRIQVTATGLPAVFFTLSSDGYRGKFGDYIPPGLFIRSLQISNDKGQTVDAAKVGTPLAYPLVSELFMLYDDFTITPSGDLVLTGIVKTKPIKNGNVFYNPSGGNVSATVNLNNGKYQTTYTSGALPALNRIEATGVADVSVPLVLYTSFITGGTYNLPSFVQAAEPRPEYPNPLTIAHYNPSQYSCGATGCKLREKVMTFQSGQQALFFDMDAPQFHYIIGQPQPTTYSVFGVRISQTPGTRVFIDKNGDAQHDLKLKYSIEPYGYQAIIADVVLMKDKTPQVYLPGDISGEGSATLARGAKFGITSVYESQVLLNNGSLTQIVSDPERVIPSRATLVADYNHSRKIDDSDHQRALNEDIYYFWVNDDDGHDDTEGTGIPGSGSLTWNRTNVNGTRDLIDFFPVYFDIKELKAAYPPSVYTYKLHHGTSSLTIVETNLDKDTSGNYLADITTAQELATAQKTMITSEGYTLPDKILNGKGVILVEAWREAITPLKLAVYDAAGKLMVTAAKLNLSIAGVEQMFRHKNLIQATGGPAPDAGDGGAENRLATPANFPDSETIDKNFVFLHGHRVKGNEARGWHSEIFKRLYWSGSKAKFFGVSWNVTNLDYYGSALNAFNTAGYLQPFLNSLAGETTVAAHSLGNMVVSSVLSDYAVTAPVKNYLLIDAAVASEAYDGTTSQSIDMVHPDWDNYKEELWASEWHKLFLYDQPTDYRSKLTWRNRFANRPANTTYHNFYSSGEDVLEVHPHSNVPSIGDVYETIKSGGRWAWALQEKFKGKFRVPLVTGSNYGGWEFNRVDYAEPVSFPDPQPLNFLIANLIDPVELRTKPFFKKNDTEAALYSDFLGSNYALRSEVKNRLLVEAIPARTLPAGRQAVPVFDMPGQSANFDMQLKYKSGWPRGNERWLHNDFIHVGYPYLYLLYDKFVNSGGLK